MVPLRLCFINTLSVESCWRFVPLHINNKKTLRDEPRLPRASDQWRRQAWDTGARAPWSLRMHANFAAVQTAELAGS